MKNSKQLFLSGFSFDIFSRAVFIISGFTINVVLSRVLVAEKYGDVAILLSVIMLLNVFLTNGIPNSLSRFIADPQINNSDLWKKTVLLQTTVVVLVTGFAVIGTKHICLYLNTPSLTRYFYLLLIILPLNGWFYLHIGALNGLRYFRQQAIVNILYPVSRIVIIFFLLFAFNLDLIAVILGTAIAYIPAFIYGQSQWKTVGNGKKISIRRLIVFSFQVMFLFGIITLFLNMDLIVIKNLEPNRELVGKYGAMINVGKIAYFLLYSFSSTIFPIISNLKAENSSERISTLLRVVLSAYIFLGVFIFMITLFFSDLIITALYGSAYLFAAANLSVYTLAIIFLSITAFFSNVLFILLERKGFLLFLFLFLLLEIIGIYLSFHHLGILAGPLMFLLSVFLAALFLGVLLNRVEKGSIPISNICLYFTFAALSFVLVKLVMVNIEMLWLYYTISILIIVSHFTLGLLLSPGLIKGVRNLILIKTL